MLFQHFFFYSYVTFIAFSYSVLGNKLNKFLKVFIIFLLLFKFMGHDTTSAFHSVGWLGHKLSTLTISMCEEN